MRKIFLLFVVAMLLNVASGFSQGTVNYNVSGLQFGDQSVVSFGSDSYLNTKTVSANGSYIFGSIPAGKYFIKIEASGYNLPNAQTVIVHQDGSIDPSVGINLVITKMAADSTVWTHSWNEDVSNSGYTTTAYVNNPPTIEFLGAHIVPSDIPFTGVLQNNYNIVLSNEEETWTQEYAYRLVETLKTIPYFNNVQALERSKFVLTNDHLFEDVSVINYGDTAKLVRISKDCFTYANPFLINLDGVRGRFFSKRLHHALVDFATDFGNNLGRVNKILSERFGCTTNVPDYSALTAGITNEDAGRFQPFNPDELVSIINMFEELPEGFHKTYHLNYLIRRLNGTKHPIYPEAPAVAWPVDNGYIEYMETAFGGDANGSETLRLILHEKTHFLWEYTFSEEIKNDWIALGGWYPDPNSSSGWSTTKEVEFVSAYAHSKNPNEDMAESVANYLKNPELLQSRSMTKYEFIRDRIMHGTRYISKIPDYLTFEVLNLYPDYDYPGKIKHLDVKVEGSPDEDKVVTVEIELNHIEGFEDGASYAYTRIASSNFIDANGTISSQFVDMYFYPVNGNPFVLRGSVKISKYSKAGYWTAGDIVVTDIQHNQRFEGRNDYVWNMYVINPLEDLAPPKYVPGSLNYELTDTIANGHSAKNLRITYKVTDNIGVQTTFIRLVRDGGTHSFGDMYGKYNPITQRATIDVLLTEYMSSNYYYVTFMMNSDSAGNAKYTYFTNSPTDQPIQKIYIETTNPDTIAPEVDENRITVYAQPTHPDNPDGETLVTINYYARDNKSGLGQVSYRLRDPQGIDHFEYHYHRNFYTTYFDGNPTVWEKYTINVVLPQGSAPGIWGLSQLELTDKAWNIRINNFVETMIFEPDNSLTDYVLFSQMSDNNTVNLEITSDTIGVFGFSYRIINEETGEEVSGERTNEKSQQSKSLLKSYSSATTEPLAVDVSSLSAGKLIVIVKVKDGNGEVAAVRSGSVFKKTTQTIAFNTLDEKTYGDSVFILPETTDKGLGISYQSTDTNVATVSGNNITILNAGTTTIIATQTGNETILEAQSVIRLLTVGKAMLSITADNKTIRKGEKNPTFTLSYSGFKNNETENVLDVLPEISCDANENSSAGFYPIVLNGGNDNNYAYNLVNGKLQISNQSYTQNIPLIAGWNIISSNVVPSITNLKDMVQPLIDGGKLNKVMDESGKVIEDFGAFGGWQNGIGAYSQTEGYKVNMTGTDALVLQGMAVKLPFSISLSAGWNITPYPCANAQSALTMVQSLIDIHTLDKVMDESGKVIEDFGAYGGWKNNIGDFTAGKGYKIKVNQASTLTINSSELRSATKAPTVLPSAYFTKAFIGNGTDHMNIHLVDLAASSLQIGDEIGIFDGKVCVGSAAIGEDQVSEGSISIPASCNDGQGETVNGYIPGHPVELRLYREGETFDLTLEKLRGNATFEKDGSLFAKVTSKQPTNVSNTDGSILFFCHPNPFAEEIQIDVRNIASTKLTVDIYNLFGQKIKMLYEGANTGLLHLKWNGTNDKGNRIVAGVYLCRVNDQSKKIVFIGGE